MTTRHRAAPDLTHAIAHALAAPSGCCTTEPPSAAETTAAIARALASPYTYRTELPAQHAPELAESEPSPAEQPSSSPVPAPEPPEVAALRLCWQRGASTRVAAAEAGVSQSTAARQYRRFRVAAREAAAEAGVSQLDQPERACHDLATTRVSTAG